MTFLSWYYKALQNCDVTFHVLAIMHREQNGYIHLIITKNYTKKKKIFKLFSSKLKLEARIFYKMFALYSNGAEILFM